MDSQIVKEIYIELVAILGTFRKCFSEAEKTNEHFDNMFQQFINDTGWINLDHLKIEKCIELTNRNYEKARQIKDPYTRKTLMKAMCCYVTPMLLYYKKGDKMDKAGCGDHFYTNLTSMDNICYFIENKLINNKNVQLFQLNNVEQFHMVYAHNVVTKQTDDYMLGFIFLVAENNKFNVEVMSIEKPYNKINMEIYAPHDFQVVNFVEVNGSIESMIDTRLFDDSGYDLRGV